jgi:hypothetical protein
MKRFDRWIAAARIFGAVVFVFMLAGVGSGILMDATPYHP